MTATRCEWTEDPVTNSTLHDVCADFYNAADEFMARNHPRCDIFASMVLVQVGTTDAGSFHRNDRIALTMEARFDQIVAEPNLLNALKDQTPH